MLAGDEDNHQLFLISEMSRAIVDDALSEYAVNTGKKCSHWVKIKSKIKVKNIYLHLMAPIDKL